MLLISAALLFAVTLSEGRSLQTTSQTTSECQPSWSARLDTLLANTPESGSQGRATFSLVDDETLYFRIELPEGSKLKAATLQQSNNQTPDGGVELPLTTQMQHTVEESISANSTVFADALELLSKGKTSLTVEVNAERHQRLIGAMRDDCQPGIAAAPIAWEEALQSLPACNVPGFSELYRIPSSCSNFARRVEQNCQVQVEDVLVASAHDANGQPVMGSLAVAVCLPSGCDPCQGAAEESYPMQEAWSNDHELFPTVWVETEDEAANPCHQPGFEGYYPIPVTCDNLPDRLEDFCGVNIQDVLQASAQSLGLLLKGICIPDGCDPCAAYPSETSSVADALSVAPPFCEKTLLFTKPFSIPSDCGHFQEALQDKCGIEAEAVAEASSMEAFPEFAGFGPGKTVCLPEFCEPCEASPMAAAVAAL